MPLATMASAMARTSAAVIFPAKWFQLFQPIGGVAARPLDGTGATAAGSGDSAARTDPVVRAAGSGEAKTRREEVSGTASVRGHETTHVSRVARLLSGLWRGLVREPTMRASPC